MSYLEIYRTTKEEFKKSNKPYADALACRWFYRPAGFFLTPFFIKAGLSGTQVSLIGLMVGWLANILFVLGGNFILLGAVLYVIFCVIDFCDGNVARHRNESTHHGRLIDYFVGASVSAFTPLFVAIGVAQGNDLFLFLTADQYVFLGAFASLLNMLAKNGEANYKLEKAKTEHSTDRPDPAKTEKQSNLSFKDLTSGTTHITLLALAMAGLAEFFVYLVFLMAAASLLAFIKKLVMQGPQELGQRKI